MEQNQCCPDNGVCHHECSLYGGECFRVLYCSPLFGVYINDEWPADVILNAGRMAS